MEEQKKIAMTKEQYENRFEQLKNAIRKLQSEYIKSSHIQVGDDVMVCQYNGHEGKKGQVTYISASWNRKDIDYTVQAYKKNGQLGSSPISTRWGAKVEKL